MLTRLSQADAVEKMVAASGGYDLPAFKKLTEPEKYDSAEKVPEAALYSYPNPHKHQLLALGVAGATEGCPARQPSPRCACALPRRAHGLAWAEGELEGFMRS